MNLSEQDKEKIKKMRRKYRFLKGFTEEEVLDLFLDRCDNCFEVCFSDDLVPIVNFIGEVHKCCGKCQKTVLDDMFYSKEDYELQILEDKYYDEL